ncbi:radical SAM superfamily enzyme YgiQ (UPF0313 family) [Azospirillum fermentarium]|uniref:B12-binding domain-containing radical SAM protein n=1 Tax=Azospirillum fermentarium TaxID=1233114 RepID=UPI0022272744|nr:radical SAM protein [Azospirillum fermentarium]MCW2249542.1 radical SAM superfamily enzyme YgiQ (UPF0313 family) [Azospirillum fermentarium]
MLSGCCDKMICKMILTSLVSNDADPDSGADKGFMMIGKTMCESDRAYPAPGSEAQSGSLNPIGLIIPPSAFLLDERVFVSLGILKIASALEQQGHAVALLDLSGIKNFDDALVSFLDDNVIKVIGITATTPQLPAIAVVAATIRRLRPDIRLILGGPHVTLVYAALKLERRTRPGVQGRAAQAAAQLEEMFDVLVTGDGERAVFAALAPDAPKVIDGDDNKGPYFLSNADFTASPLPARHLIDLNTYKYSIEGSPATSLIAQLGCPFSCGFCGGRNSKSLRIIRTRTVESILAEVKFLHKEYGYTGFMFYDDELNVTKTMVNLLNGLADLQEELGAKFQLRGFVKAELFTEEQAEAMVRAGFRWLLCGFEAAHPRILTNIRKRATLEENTRAVEIAKKYGLKVKALMSLGHPGETEETALSIRDWLIKSQVDDFDCTVITTYPGTPYYDEAVPHPDLPDVWTYTQPETGDRLHSENVNFMRTAEYYKGDPEGGYVSHIFTDALSPRDIVNLRNVIERDVRAALGIPFNPSRAAVLYEHSMGQSLPPFILRSSSVTQHQ